MTINQFITTAVKYIRNVDFSSDRSVNALKTTLACLLGWLSMRLLHLPMGQWIIVSTLVVMSAQSNFGGLVLKSSMRFVGTSIGAVVAAITIFFFDHNTLVTVIILLISIAIFTYVAGSPKTISNAGTLGAVTVVIILLGQQPTLSTAVERFTEINLGILIALAVAKLIFPIHASKNLRVALAESIQNLAALYDISLAQLQGPIVIEAYEHLETKIIADFANQRKLISEAVAEGKKTTFNKATYEQIIVRMRKIYRSIALLNYALIAAKDRLSIIFNGHSVADLNQSITTSLRQLALTLKEPETFIELDSLKQAIDRLAHAIKIANKALVFMDEVNLHSFLFCIQYLGLQITKLSALLKSTNPNSPGK